uniref:F-box associated beta-propeller type 3 domain-containing protein n=1 Tax=Aegilops tauschii TaxID=37682 RepID=M8C4Z6_AEGTA
MARTRAAPSASSSSKDQCNHPILERGRGRLVLGLDDYFDNNGFKLHASSDGLLLLALSDGRFSICNTATRECASLPGLTASGSINILALYLHRPLGEYRVLYWKGIHHAKAAAHYIFTVRQRGTPRCIGVPYTPTMEKAILAGHKMAHINSSPPFVFRNCLHWLPGWLCDDGIVVFDTVAESFRSMCGPPAATSCYTRLCDMEGSIGFSCLDEKGTVARIWVLEDYEREVWSFKYHVKFPVEDYCHFTDMRHFILSCKGDVLVYNTSACYMFHCDNTGKLLEEFRWEPKSQDLHVTGRMFKESLVEHEFFQRRGLARAGQPSFFQRI